MIVELGVITGYSIPFIMTAETILFSELDKLNLNWISSPTLGTILPPASKTLPDWIFTGLEIVDVVFVITKYWVPFPSAKSYS